MRTKFYLPILLICFHGYLSAKNVKDKTSAIESKVQKILSKKDKQTEFGAYFSPVKSSRPIYSSNAESQFAPGSVLKVFTAAAALDVLGPAFRFETRILIDPPEENQIKNLYIEASGDPNFSEKEFHKIVQTLRQWGITTIKQNIIVDNGNLSGHYRQKDWLINDLKKGYAAPVSALSLSNNKIAVFVWPGINPTDPATVTLEPYTNYIQIENSSTTLPEDKSGRISFTTSSKRTMDKRSHGLKPNQTIHISGKISKSKTYQYDTFSVDDPKVYIGHYIKEQLEDAGILFQGKIINGPIPAEAHLVDTISSKTLAESLVDIMKFSNNNSSEALLKALGTTQNSQNGTFESGAKVVKNFLDKTAKINTKNLVIKDGSGLSHKSLVSPKQLANVLKYVWSNFEIGPEFIASLPIVGEDLFFSGLWKESPLRSRIRAKSGTTSTICSLAGFMKTKKNETLAFSMILNGKKTVRYSCKAQFHDILEVVHNEF